MDDDYGMMTNIDESLPPFTVNTPPETMVDVGAETRYLAPRYSKAVFDIGGMIQQLHSNEWWIIGDLMDSWV